MEWHVQTLRNQQSAEGTHILSLRLDRFIDQTTDLISQEIVDRLIDKWKQSLEDSIPFYCVPLYLKHRCKQLLWSALLQRWEFSCLLNCE